MTDGPRRAAPGAADDRPTPTRPLASAWRVGGLAAAGAVATSAVVPALNEVQQALDLTPAAVAGLLSAYIVPYSVATIVAGQFADAHGPRRVLRVALLAAVAGGLLAGLADTGPWVLLGRALQGAGAGAVTMSAFDAARRLPNGIATTAAALTLGSAAGPLLGGVATDLLGWPAAFLLPAAIHATGLVRLRVPDEAHGRGGVDGVGLSLTALAAAGLAGALQTRVDLPSVALVLLVVGLPAAALAGRRSWRGVGSVPPTALLRSAPLRRRGMLAASIAATYFASLVLIPVALGEVGYSPIGIGVALLPPAVTGAIAARRSDAIGARLGRSTDAVAAVLALVVLVAVLTAPPLVAALSISGLSAAFGIVQPRLLAVVSAEVDSGPATAIGTANLVLLLGGGAGSAAIGGLGAGAGGVVLVALVGLTAATVVRASLRAEPAGRTA